ncbi:Hypothetical_protein [Hexamita inflata]|uniref:Hypothetical_protein n=1 Tax=Hexamita inflata TaxID=28002 RepID=A0AA86QAN9_9EUKA|nr:Hypothetical protein HINF_LOCUS37072 [Hexamita inflata]
MSVLMRRENTLIIEPGSDISKIQIINFILLPNSKKHFEGPPLYITRNISHIEINIMQNTSVLDQRIANNVTSLNKDISSLNNQFTMLDSSIKSMNHTLQIQLANNIILSQNISSLQQNIISANIIIKKQSLSITDLGLQIQCLNQGYFVETNQYQIIVNIQNSCAQVSYICVFDIAVVTHLANSFSPGYVFSTGYILNNAFVDIVDNVYSTIVQPLFQDQNSFSNIKIQIGAQTVNSGQILTQSNALTINQMKIISRLGIQIIVNTASQLNILVQFSVGSTINNLLINFNFAESSGNITLISGIGGAMNVSGYTVLGTFQSIKTVAMIGLNAYKAKLILNQLSFRPSVYNVGNCSSFAISYINQTLVTITSISIIIGNNITIAQIGDSISTTDKYKSYYHFGGVVTDLNSSDIYIQQMILDAYTIFSVNFVSFSGLIVGTVLSQSSTVTLLNICAQASIYFSSGQINWFGVIGYNKGNISLQHSTMLVTINQQVCSSNSVGVVGSQSISSGYAEILSLQLQFQVIADVSSWGNVGSLFGYMQANIVLIQDVVVQNSKITAGQWVGGFAGYLYNTASIINSILKSSNISGQNCVAGFIGLCSNAQVTISDTQILNTKITAQSYFGLISNSDNDNSFYITSSFSAQNYINEIKQLDCTITNALTQNGC